MRTLPRRQLPALRITRQRHASSHSNQPGPNGIGPQSLIAPAHIEDSRGNIQHLDVSRVSGIETWNDMRDALHSQSLWEPGDTVIVDTATAAEELAVAHTIATVKHENGAVVKSIEGYGWGKGYVHVSETFLQLFSDLDCHYRAGRNVIVICHREAKNVPNPAGTDFLQYQPRLQDSSRGNIRARFQEWCDHLIHLDFDTHVSENGKAVGGSSRTIYPTALATFWAKSRTMADPIVWKNAEDATLWTKLLNKEI